LLENDLKGLTAVTVPPMKADDDKGYFEIVEGCIGPVIQPEGNPFLGVPGLTGLFYPNGNPMLYPDGHLWPDSKGPIRRSATSTTS